MAINTEVYLNIFDKSVNQIEADTWLFSASWGNISYNLMGFGRNMKFIWGQAYLQRLLAIKI
jgi:hypothetical protein